MVCGSEYSFKMIEENKESFCRGSYWSNPEVCQVNKYDETGNRIYPEVYRVNTDDGPHDRIAPEAHQVDTGYEQVIELTQGFFRLIDKLYIYPEW